MIPFSFRTALLYSLILCGVSISSSLYGQTTEVYPPELYPGENVLTIKSPRGIENLRVLKTRNLRVEAPDGYIGGCPDSVNIRVFVDSATTMENLELTVFHCDGSISQSNIQNRDWRIRQEYTGRVDIGSDTCISCFVESSRLMFLDSIVVDHPGLRVEIPALRSGHGKYIVRSGIRFPYQVCYSPEKVENAQSIIQLHFQRDYPAGGLNSYVIRKPIVMEAVEPPPPVVEKDPEPVLPPLRDPTTFRNIVMPTAESPEKGEFFYGNFIIVGSLAGYGITDRVSLLGGGVFVPDFIGPLYLGTFGLKYEAFRSDLFRAAIGIQIAQSATEDSDIRTIAPYAVGSYGNDEHRLSAALGYGLKRHVTPIEEFDRNALTFALGGNTTISRGWKLAAETYIIETSGIAPLLFSARKFTDNFAFDFGLGIDLVGGSEIIFTDGLSGEITQLAIAPFISGMWVF